MRPSDGVLGGLRGNEPRVLQMNVGDRTTRFEGHAQGRRSGRHRFVSSLAPSDLDTARAADTNEVTADENTVDVDGEDAAIGRFETRDIAHPTNEELGPHEMIEDLLGRRFDLDGRAEGLAHRFFSISSLSV